MKYFTLILALATFCSACVPPIGERPFSDDMASKVDQRGEDLDEGGVDQDPLDQDKPDQDQGRDMAPDLEPDLGACGQLCAGAMPVCDEVLGECVGCLDNTTCEPTGTVCRLDTKTCVGCLSDTDCNDPDVPVAPGDSMSCDTDTNTCVECLSNEQCPMPESSSCDLATNTCAGCASDAECTHLPDIPYCEESVCQACRPDTEEDDCGAFSCDPATFTCTATERASLSFCEECRADSECSGNTGCVALKFGSGADEIDTGAFCLPKAPIMNTCPNVYRESLNTTTLSGQTDVYCAPKSFQTSCPAVLAQAVSTCTAAEEDTFPDQCGIAGQQDGICVLYDSNFPNDYRCSILCEGKDDCRGSEKCKPNDNNLKVCVQQ